jgi:Na+-driven multidrug efflux pump
VIDSQATFLSGNLFRHITVMSLTASVGLVAVFAVDFIDMIFISMLGNDALAAAIGYAGAILFFTSSFGIGMAIAAGAVVARSLGQVIQSWRVTVRPMHLSMVLSSGLFLRWLSG